MGSPNGLVKTSNPANCEIAMTAAMLITLEATCFLSWKISQEVQTAKKVQASPPKIGAIGAKGPLNCTSANPIHGKPVKI